MSRDLAMSARPQARTPPGYVIVAIAVLAIVVGCDEASVDTLAADVNGVKAHGSRC